MFWLFCSEVCVAGVTAASSVETLNVFYSSHRYLPKLSLWYTDCTGRRENCLDRLLRRRFSPSSGTCCPAHLFSPPTATATTKVSENIFLALYLWILVHSVSRLWAILTRLEVFEERSCLRKRVDRPAVVSYLYVNSRQRWGKLIYSADMWIFEIFISKKLLENRLYVYIVGWVARVYSVKFNLENHRQESAPQFNLSCRLFSACLRYRGALITKKNCHPPMSLSSVSDWLPSLS